MEQEYLFPMLKSSDLGNGSTSEARYFMLVPQKKVGEDTDKIRSSAPRTWLYLLNHAALLDARGSIIYKKNPRFSIFGVGDYAFSEWKVAISGFYKKLNFQVVGPIGGKATVFDDTVYFISAESKDEAEFLCMLLNSEPCQRYLNSMIFWDEKKTNHRRTSQASEPANGGFISRKRRALFVPFFWKPKGTSLRGRQRLTALEWNPVIMHSLGATA
jgi:hypothetical protein